MIEVRYEPFQKSAKATPHLLRNASLESKMASRSSSIEKFLLKTLILLVFSAIYWIFCSVYLYTYKDEVVLALRQGYSSFIRSETFRSFQLDLLMCVGGYITLMAVLYVAVFRN